MSNTASSHKVIKNTYSHLKTGFPDKEYFLKQCNNQKDLSDKVNEEIENETNYKHVAKFTGDTSNTLNRHNNAANIAKTTFEQAIDDLACVTNETQANNARDRMQRAKNHLEEVEKDVSFEVRKKNKDYIEKDIKDLEDIEQNMADDMAYEKEYVLKDYANNKEFNLNDKNANLAWDDDVTTDEANVDGKTANKNKTTDKNKAADKNKAGNKEPTMFERLGRQVLDALVRNKI